MGQGEDLTAQEASGLLLAGRDRVKTRPSPRQAGALGGGWVSVWLGLGGAPAASCWPALTLLESLVKLGFRQGSCSWPLFPPLSCLVGSSIRRERGSCGWDPACPAALVKATTFQLSVLLASGKMAD